MRSMRIIGWQYCSPSDMIVPLARSLLLTVIGTKPPWWCTTQVSQANSCIERRARPRGLTSHDHLWHRYPLSHPRGPQGPWGLQITMRMFMQGKWYSKLNNAKKLIAWFKLSKGVMAKWWNGLMMICWRGKISHTHKNVFLSHFLVQQLYNNIITWKEILREHSQIVQGCQ